LERPIHAKPVSFEEYEAERFSLYSEARREGVVV